MPNKTVAKGIKLENFVMLASVASQIKEVSMVGTLHDGLWTVVLFSPLVKEGEVEDEEIAMLRAAMVDANNGVDFAEMAGGLSSK